MSEGISPFRVTVPVVGGLIEHALGLSHLAKGYDEVRARVAHTEADFCTATLDVLGVRCEPAAEELERIPREGPAVVVANHPFGGLEGVILASLLRRVRPDVRVLANRLLARIPEMRDVCFFVDAFGTGTGTRDNARAVRAALRWVRDGGMLAVFPAGAVSHLLGSGVADPAWQGNTARLIRLAQAPVLPMHFEGANGPLFQLAGLVHPRLRTALLPRELLNKRGAVVTARIGHPIAPRVWNRIESDAVLSRYLRMRTYLLRRREAKRRRAPAIRTPLPIIPAEDRHRLIHELSSLPSDQLLVEGSGFRVFLASWPQAPALMREIGRLRETAFRSVGEGTGLACDVDRFDRDYLHLALWHDESRELAGAYRLGLTDRLLRDRGPSGLYSSTLFRLGPEFYARLGPAIEMGRSFITENHQRNFSSLMMLWKGIGAFVVRHPHYRTLYGPVSISNRYSPVSQSLMIEWLVRHSSSEPFAPLAAPRRPVRVRIRDRRAASRSASLIRDVSELSGAVADIEYAHRGVPVLVREYLKLGGRFASFSVDPEFGDVVDGLVIVELPDTPRRTLDRYLGREGAASFLAYQSGPCAALPAT